MSRKPITRLNPKQLGRLFATVTDKADPALDGSDDQTIRRAKSGEHIGRSEGASVSASREHLLEQPGTWIGRYKLLKVLGEGGMGIVYLAEQEQPIKRQVALKVVKPGMDSQRVIGRFEAERQALALLHHPGIAHVYDAGTTEAGRPYFVMELVTGVSIIDYCDQHKLTI
jgi:serine/threonine protein kinase